jgi:hypothetical protein
MKKFLAIFVPLCVVLVVFVTAYFMHKSNSKSVEETASVGYYESIRPDSAVTYNVMKPTGGYVQVDIAQSSDINYLSIEPHFEDIFYALFVDDEYITDVTLDAFIVVPELKHSEGGIYTIDFTYKGFAEDRMYLIINTEEQVITYGVY